MSVEAAAGRGSCPDAWQLGETKNRVVETPSMIMSLKEVMRVFLLVHEARNVKDYTSNKMWDIRSRWYGLSRSLPHRLVQANPRSILKPSPTAATVIQSITRQVDDGTDLYFQLVVKQRKTWCSVVYQGELIFCTFVKETAAVFSRWCVNMSTLSKLSCILSWPLAACLPTLSPAGTKLSNPLPRVLLPTLYVILDYHVDLLYHHQLAAATYIMLCSQQTPF